MLTIDSAMLPRTRRADVAHDVSLAVREYRQKRDAYRHGVTAERQSWRHCRVLARAAVRRAYQSGVGRRIDLIALLRQRDRNKKPVWALVDPTQEIDWLNGGVDYNGVFRVGGHPVDTHKACDQPHEKVPSGIPPLPQRARQIVLDKDVRRRAVWVGVLFEPDSWIESDPDPAVVVRWRCCIDKYNCLAVWGGDRAVIEEFIE